MTKQEIRRELSICFLQGLRDVMLKDPELQVVHVCVKLKPDPDFNNSGCFSINLFQNQ